jgi:multiple sugar transport system substrate-binding protein
LPAELRRSAQDKELTIFWAEWDPANYLQELVNEYEAETGVKVTVETTPWSDFQTKAFAEFNAKGSGLRHDRRRLAVARRRF